MITQDDRTHASLCLLMTWFKYKVQYNWFPGIIGADRKYPHNLTVDLYYLHRQTMRVTILLSTNRLLGSIDRCRQYWATGKRHVLLYY